MILSSPQKSIFLLSLRRKSLAALVKETRPPILENKHITLKAP